VHDVPGDLSMFYFTAQDGLIREKVPTVCNFYVYAFPDDFRPSLDAILSQLDEDDEHEGQMVYSPETLKLFARMDRTHGKGA
jgi:hypothetical protein